MNAVGAYLAHLLRPDSLKWRPILSVYYLTYACSFRCPYCCDGSGTPYHRLRSPVLSADRVLALFEIIRRHCEYLVITGGEPLQHPDYAEIFNRLPALRFRSVILTTNGYHLGQALPAALDEERAAAVGLLVRDLDRVERHWPAALRADLSAPEGQRATCASIASAAAPAISIHGLRFTSNTAARPRTPPSRSMHSPPRKRCVPATATPICSPASPATPPPSASGPPAPTCLDPGGLALGSRPLRTGASSNGRTADSDSAYRGSNPCAPTINPAIA